MPGLFKASSIDLVTDEGHHEVQLLLGDITKLPLEEKVDLIMISSFPGDYTATPTSVIGALKRAFGLNVRDLARNKAEDLRRNFNCWFSNDLDDHLPYKRLLCFEQQVREFIHPGQLIGDVFRCMIPAFNNQPSSVITPVLASGDQSFDIKVMLRSMVVAACNWIMAGLPLVCLKIVVFTREEFLDKSDIKSAYFTSLIDVFNKEKSKWESQKTKWKEAAIQFDVFLSYSREDEEYVGMIKKQLSLEKPGIRINSQKHELNLEEVWQQEIYEAMIVCLRVITILSPSYLQCSGCLDEYNMALCCNRKVERHLLAPVYLKQVTIMPTYMLVTQYIDIRIDDGDFDKLVNGCRTFVKSELSGDMIRATAARKQSDYDIFISYSHKNSTEASLILDTLQKMKPDLKVFFDRNELKTGVSWQQILYESIESSDVVLSMLSPDYVESLVCTEEYNLALACHMSSAADVSLVPILIEDMTTLPRGYSYVPAIDGRNLENIVDEICRKIVDFLENREIDEKIFQTNKAKHHLEWLMAKNRNLYFKDNIKRKPGEKTKISSQPQKNETKSDGDNVWDIFISVNDLDKDYASNLKRILQFKSDQLVIHIDTESEASQLSKLEHAKIIVAVVSPTYFKSKREQQEFHSALCRHRTERDRPVLYVIQLSPLLEKPIYPHLIPCNIACYDTIWKDVTHVADWGETLELTDAARRAWNIVNMDRRGPMKIFAALDVASESILKILSSERSDEKNTIIKNVIAIDMKVDANERIPVPDGFLTAITTEPSEQKPDNEDVIRFKSEEVHVLDLPAESTANVPDESTAEQSTDIPEESSAEQTTDFSEESTTEHPEEQKPTSDVNSAETPSQVIPNKSSTMKTPDDSTDSASKDTIPKESTLSVSVPTNVTPTVPDQPIDSPEQINSSTAAGNDTLKEDNYGRSRSCFII